MKAKEIKIDPNGGRLRVNIVIIGLIIASYEYMLFESHSNNVIQRENGNNKNPFDDNYLLPMSVQSSVGRLIDVRTNFVGIDSKNFKNYEVKAELFQDTKKLGEVSDKGKVTGDSQTSQLFIILT